MASSILSIHALGFPWETFDPFLFCVHHEDFYPAGNAEQGPAVSLAGRNLGQDFTIKDGFRMYHGAVVPGFPQHPHRGFETVTIARRGVIDHSDSLGATARFGEGDVQWLTAGRGIVHCEMFPLRDRQGPNTTELFQIWLNLPSDRKMASPYFSMLWAPTIPEVRLEDTKGRVSTIRVVAGNYEDTRAPSPPPDSWASSAHADVAIWTLALGPDASLTLPPALAGTHRTLYFFRGEDLAIDGERLEAHGAVRVKADLPLRLQAGPSGAELLLLQGRPIGEPVVQYGPFVMNTPAEIQQAFLDYRRTGFGGWPWDRDDPVHPRDAARFALHPDGRHETPPGT